jgi:hypothetical protein
MFGGSLLTAKHHFWKKNLKNLNFHKFLPFFDAAVKFDLQTYKTCTFLESAKNFPPKKYNVAF